MYTRNDVGVIGDERDEMVDGYREKSDDPDPVQLHACDTAFAVSGTLLAFMCKGRSWRLDFYSRVFLWNGRLRNGSLEALCIRNRQTEEREGKSAYLLQSA